MTVDVERVREEARLVLAALDEHIARDLADDALALCDELDRTREQLREAREALETADREASTAHDAIWHDSVQGFGNTGFGKLHDSDDPSSASSAIWRLHDVVRPTLTRLSEATPCDGSASCPAVAHVHGCFSEATP